MNLEPMLENALYELSDLVHGGYNEIIGFIGLACFAAFCLYFLSDMRQAGRRAKAARSFYR